MKILVIEDDKSIAELVRDYLDINGFEHELAFDGTSGYEKALKGDYALVILDIMLPGMNGFDICARLREKKNIPIIILSAKKDDIDKVRGLGLGADDYMTKPFSPSELIARVKGHIARYQRLTESQPVNQDIVRVRGLTIDKDSYRVFLNDKLISMPAKEYELLLFLAEHPNTVFSKDTLFDRVWGMESLGDVATVTVHIGRIREKIELDPSTPQFIETVWGVGYRFRG